MSLFGNIIKLIGNPVGNNLTNAPDDVEALKRNFSYEGRYEKPVANGYIDSEINHAIYSFQRDNGLQIDGRVNPGGETEATLAGRILGFDQSQNSNIIKVTAAPTVPALMFRLGSMLALPAAGAWEWWQNQSTPMRQQMLNTLGGQQEPDHREHCDMRYHENTARCNEVTYKKGSRAGAVCHQSASAIYAACLAGKPDIEWPPLQE